MSNRKSLFERLRIRIRKTGRNTKLAASLVAVLVIVGAWAIVFHQDKNVENLAKSETSDTSDATAATIEVPVTLTYLTGVVEVRDERGEWSKAEKDASIKTGMGLRTTGASSRAIATLDDGTAIRLDANTQIGFESLTETQISIEQDSGYVYNRIANSSQRKYEIITENAQFESAGTAFLTIASGDEEAVEVFHNSVNETTMNKIVREGKRLVAESAINSAQEGKVVDLDIEKIKDNDFINWNRSLDSQDENFKTSLGFLKDFDGPKIDIAEPVSGTTIEVASDSPQGTVSIKGKTESKAKLTVQSKSTSGSSPIDVAVQGDGSFDTGVLSSPTGSSIFEFIAKDETGNITTINVTYTFKKPVATQQQGIALTVSEDKGKAVLQWGLVGMTTPDGVKVLYKEGTEELTYKDDAQSDVVSGGATTTISGLSKDKTYSFQICRYSEDADTCDIFSNTVTITIKQ